MPAPDTKAARGVSCSLAALLVVNPGTRWADNDAVRD